jgi:hypothetical protein
VTRCRPGGNGSGGIENGGLGTTFLAEDRADLGLTLAKLVCKPAGAVDDFDRGARIGHSAWAQIFCFMWA